MKTTKQLSKALQQIQDEAIEKIKSFFNKNTGQFISFINGQKVSVVIDTTKYSVDEINKSGFVNITGVRPKSQDYQSVSLLDLSANDLLCILDELERMKTNNQLKK